MSSSLDQLFRDQTIKQSYCIQPLPPVRIGNQRQLLVDSFIIDDCWNCRRTVHQPEKHECNPLIAPSTPADGRGMPFTSVLHDPDEGLFRLWGSAHPLPGQDIGCHGVYFESTDGIEWSAPALGKISFEGSTANNIFLASPGVEHDNLAVTRMPDEWRHKGRYAMVYGSYGAASAPGVTLAFSDDGINWQEQAQNPILGGMSDTHNNLVYHPERQVFLQYRRPVINAFHSRRIAVTESADLVTWTQPRTIIFPDELDPPMLYGMTVDRYQGVFLGFLMVYYCSDIGTDASERYELWPEFPKELQMENQLTWSRDGVTWSRHPERPVFLECGRRHSACDWAFVRKGTGIVERDDELCLYYEGADRFKKTAYTDRYGNWHLCLATIRKDGFVSLDSRGEGFMLTVPLECPGGSVHVNARTKPGGWVKVAVRSGDGAQDGEWQDGMTFENSAAFSGDSTDHVVGWQHGSSLDAISGRSVRLHFWLQDASLYSFWCE